MNDPVLADLDRHLTAEEIVYGRSQWIERRLEEFQIEYEQIVGCLQDALGYEGQEADSLELESAVRRGDIMSAQSYLRRIMDTAGKAYAQERLHAELRNLS